MDVESFIETVRQNEILWNPSYPNYKCVKMKQTKWKKISSQFGVSIDECRRKWKGLRDSYTRELARQNTAGQDAHDPELQWKYTENMDFLKKHIKPRVSENIQIKEEELSAEEFSCYEDSENLPIPARHQDACLKRKERDMEANLVRTIQNINEFLSMKTQSVTADVDDEDELFCRSMALKLKKLPLEGQDRAKAGILTVLNELENDLFEES